MPLSRRLPIGALGLGLLSYGCGESSEFGDGAVQDVAATLGRDHVDGRRGHRREFDPCSRAAKRGGALQIAACEAKIQVGAAVAYEPLVAEADYASLLASDWSFVTPENAAKWGSLQPERPRRWSFEQADAIVSAARRAGQGVRGHTLVWHTQLPPFVDYDLGPREFERLLSRHIERTVERYSRTIQVWDVVNEAVADDGALRNSVFLQTLGPNYVARAFRDANRADRDAALFYNDYGIERANAKSDAVYELLADLLARRVPVDGVGFQMHLDAQGAPSLQQLLDNFARFAALGLEIHITEMDVRVAGLAVPQPERLAIQKQIYHRVVSACLQTPRCTSITTWGLTDRYSWIDSVFGPDDPLLFDDNFARKPAYYGMIDGFRGLEPDSSAQAPNLIANGSFEAGADGWFGFGIPAVTLELGRSHTGRHSGLAGGRSATWQGPAYDLRALVTPGRTYAVSGFARIGGAASDALRLTAKVSCTGESDRYIGLAGAVGSESEFVELKGTLEVPLCSLAGLALYVEGPAAGVDVLVDDFVVRPGPEPLGPNIAANGDFEGGVAGWAAWGGALLSTTDRAPFGGAASGLVSGRTEAWQGPVYDLLPLATPGASYHVNAAVRLEGAAEGEVSLTTKIVCAGSESYTRIAVARATEAGWALLSGTLNVPVCPLGELWLYAEGPPAGVAIGIDDLSVQRRLLVPITSNVVANPDFEVDTSGWMSFGAPIAVSSTHAHGGLQSGSAYGRTAAWQGIAYALPTSAANYAVQAYALHGGLDATTLRLSAKLVCSGVTTYDTVSSLAAPPGTWVPLAGSLSVPSDCSEALLYLEQDGGTTFPDVFIDDVEVRLP